MDEYLTDLDYQIFIIEQSDDKPFNRGKLLNIGFKYAVRKRCDYVVFHDVDKIPISIDYSYADYPIHLATNDIPFKEYFGGVTLFPVQDFQKINGFSNNYWGWGFEDDDLRYRCVKHNLHLNRLTFNNKAEPSSLIKFNGVNAYLKSKNLIDFKKSFSFTLKFIPEKQAYNHKEQSDKFTLLSIPNYDLSINYTSFNRYQVEVFDSRKRYHHIYSSIKLIRPLEHFIAVTYDHTTRKLGFYINNNKIKEIIINYKLLDYSKEPYLYIGSSNGKKNYFKGYIKEIGIFNNCLKDTEIEDIENNKEYGLIQNFKSYENSHSLITYYDSKFIKDYKAMDLSFNDNDAQIFNCEIVNYSPDKKYFEYFPYRRNSELKELSHENNGFENGKWKSQMTRWNQLKFNNEVETGTLDTDKDGLCDLSYKVLSENNVNKVIYIKVEL